MSEKSKIYKKTNQRAETKLNIKNEIKSPSGISNSSILSKSRSEYLNNELQTKRNVIKRTIHNKNKINSSFKSPLYNYTS